TAGAQCHRRIKSGRWGIEKIQCRNGSWEGRAHDLRGGDGIPTEMIGLARQGRRDGSDTMITRQLGISRGVKVEIEILRRFGADMWVEGNNDGFIGLTRIEHNLRIRWAVIYAR